MGATIDHAEVRRIARLARLELTDEQVSQFAVQLSRILEYFEQLDEVDTEGVEPLAHPLPITDVTRDDEPRAGLSGEAALANAPQREGEFFRVPAVLDPASGA
jgi:aspartyl-tRNA(Asn)/glutamyl-tRNA(Gln) amidotransferase subunit C